MKVCTRCEIEKPLGEFSTHNTTKDGLRPYCKPCAVKGAMEWQAKNRDRRNAYRRDNPMPSNQGEARHTKHLKRTYGLGRDEYEAMLEVQAHACAICGGTDTKRLSVDHCHLSQRIRGLLCRKCNTGLGFFRDDPEIVKRAAAYLAV